MLRRSAVICGVAPFTFDGRYKDHATKAATSPMWFVDGQFREAKQSMDVLNPATGDVIGRVGKCGREEAEEAITVASKTFGKWSKSIARDRAVILRKWSELMIKYEKDLAALMTRENGKTLAESLGENTYSSRYVEWYANEAERVYGDIIPSPRHGVITTVQKKPIGVVGVILPWNFPSAMVTRACAGAIAAGCTVVVKPSELTPYSAFALCQLTQEAGLPPGVLNCLVGNAGEIGDAMMDSFAVRKFAFTGSTATGKMLMEKCCKTVKKMSMEMGGNAPFIVFDDAEIDKAVAGLMTAKFRNGGQVCVAANRILVQEAAYDEFVAKLVDKVKGLKIGDGLAAGTTLGPVINQQAVTRIEGLLDRTVKEGGKILCGGKRNALPVGDAAPSAKGNFLPATVVVNVTNDMEICQSEIFGPVVPIVKFKTEDEAIAIANNTRAGLASYFFTTNAKRQWRVADALQYGMTAINEGIMSTPVAPFGGVKESGMGRDGSKYGIESFLDIQYVLHGNN